MKTLKKSEIKDVKKKIRMIIDLNENIVNNTNQENINNISKETDNSLKEVKEKEYIVKESSYKKNSYVLQLASVSDIKLVPKEWKRLLRIYPKLGEKKYEIKKINLKNGDTYYRILIGNFISKKEAQEFCKNILKKSSCIIKAYE